MRHRFLLIVVVTIITSVLFKQKIQAHQSIKPDTARVISIKITIPQLSRKRTINVYLPAGYTTSSRKYPVIYLQDGQNIFAKAGNNAGSWSVDSLLKMLPANKQSIIVGINNGSDKYRMTEYNAYDSSYGKEEGMAYIEFIVKTLKPYIDSNYRSKTGSKYTAIAGSSMGGLISMYAAAKYSNVFGAAGVFSPAFWLSPEIYSDVSNQPINKKSMFFLACGDDEGNEADYVNKMVSILHTKGFSINKVPNTLIIKGAKHNEQQWRIDFEKFYECFMDKL
jgi:predicted alpha/beta superfamily hydrolase